MENGRDVLELIMLGSGINIFHILPLTLSIKDDNEIYCKAGSLVWRSNYL